MKRLLFLALLASTCLVTSFSPKPKDFFNPVVLNTFEYLSSSYVDFGVTPNPNNLNFNITWTVTLKHVTYPYYITLPGGTERYIGTTTSGHISRWYDHYNYPDYEFHSVNFIECDPVNN